MPGVWGNGFIPSVLALPCLNRSTLVRRMHAQLLELAVQRAAFHADELRGAADIAAEAQQLRLQVLRFEHVARVTQR